MNEKGLPSDASVADVTLDPAEPSATAAAGSRWRRWWFSLTPQALVGVATIASLSLSLFFTVQLAFRSQIQLTASSTSMLHALRVEEQLQSILAGLTRAEADMRSFLATHASEHRALLAHERGEVSGHVAQLRALIGGSDLQLANLERLQNLLNERFALMDRLAESVQPGAGGDLLQLLLSDRGYETNNIIRGETATILTQVRADAAGQQEQFAGRTRQALGWLSFFVLLNVGAVIGVIILVRRAGRMHRFVKVCAWSKNIEYNGEWMTFEQYLEARFDIHASHGISPAEAAKMMGTMPAAR